MYREAISDVILKLKLHNIKADEICESADKLAWITEVIAIELINENCKTNKELFDIVKRLIDESRFDDDTKEKHRKTLSHIEEAGVDFFS